MRILQSIDSEKGGRRKKKTYPTHGIHCAVAEFVRKVVALDEADTMFAGDGAFHGNGILDHAMDDLLGKVLLFFVEEEDCYMMISFD